MSITLGLWWKTQEYIVRWSIILSSPHYKLAKM